MLGFSAFQYNGLKFKVCLVADNDFIILTSACIQRFRSITTIQDVGQGFTCLCILVVNTVWTVAVRKPDGKVEFHRLKTQNKNNSACCARCWKVNNDTSKSIFFFIVSTQPKRPVNPDPSTPAIKEGGVKPAKSSQVIKSRAPSRPLPAPPPSA